MTRKSKQDPHTSVGKADDLASRAAALQEKLQKLLDEVSELIAQSRQIAEEMTRKSRRAADRDKERG